MDRVWREITYDNLKYNLELVKTYAKDKDIICMVKDNAYGHGSIAISSFLEKDEKVKAFAVASIGEANKLSDSGIKKDIIIITHINKNDYEEAIKRNYVITISTIEQAMSINELASRMGKAARVEIAVDTGMSRIGFKSDDNSVKDIISISKLKNVKIYGIFSHFAVADCEENDLENIHFTDEQEKKFDSVVRQLKDAGIESIDTSISNSAGILSKRGLQFSSVRPGIVLYGLVPSKVFENVKLRPIMALKSRIIHIIKIDKDTSVSYGRTFIAKKNMRIATVSCGYGDGYPRSASNKLDVLIDGKRCRILGRVAMDMLMVDVSNVDCKVDDEVVLIGKSKNEEITLDELCDKTGEFTYEILTSINSRVQNVYIE